MLKGLATGIGSLPHQDADKALDLIFKYTPQVPFWPQLPKRDAREGMTAQFMERLPVPELPGADTLSNKVSAYPPEEKRLEEFYEKIINKEIGYFQISRSYSEGLYVFKERLEKEKGLLEKVKFIKCQITGPFTVGASIKDEDGVAYLHNPIFMQAFIKGLSMKAIWQIDFFKEFNKKILMFIDEPYLGCFGSAYTPLNKEEAVKGLSELAAGIKSAPCLLGVHCCGNTDWSIFTDVAGIDIISFDAFDYQEKFVLYAESLKSFLGRGGVICWGIVPTQGFTGKETAQDLISKLEKGVEALVKKGINRDLLLKNLLFSPACGLGALAPSQAEAIFSLLSQVSCAARLLA